MRKIIFLLLIGLLFFTETAMGQQLASEATERLQNEKVVSNSIFFQSAFTFQWSFNQTGPDSMYIYADYFGNTDSTSQLGCYFGPTSSSTFDSVKSAVIPTGNGTIIFSFVNLQQNTAYKFKLYGWNVSQGISFMPSSGAYYDTTLLVPQYSVYALNMTCSNSKLYYSRNSNVPVNIWVKYDTVSTLNSVYSITYGTTPTYQKPAGNVPLDSIVLTNFIPNQTHYARVFIQYSTNSPDSSNLVQCFNPLGVEELDGSTVIRFYPNPFSGPEATIESDLAGMMEIYSVLGEKIRTERIWEGENKLERKDLAPGMYIWKLYGDGKVCSGKFIVE
jgi:hypothetical protein